MENSRRPLMDAAIVRGMPGDDVESWGAINNHDNEQARIAQAGNLGLPPDDTTWGDIANTLAANNLAYLKTWYGLPETATWEDVLEAESRSCGRIR